MYVYFMANIKINSFFFRFAFVLYHPIYNIRMYTIPRELLSIKKQIIKSSLFKDDFNQSHNNTI